MTTNRTPQEAQARADQAFCARDIDALLACYHKDAVIVLGPDLQVQGHEHIEPALVRLLGNFQKTPGVRHESPQFIEVGDVALFSSRGTVYDGDVALLSRYGTAVLKRDAAGHWRIAIDNPHGASSLEGASANA